ncbi:MAG: Sec-independent protein translocase subunit TatA/TatB, partial [Acidimicrobiales bacterium]
MFNVGGGEILAILVIALIVLGPDKLPNAARQAGKYLNEFRRISSGFQDEIRGAMDLAAQPDPTPVKMEPAAPAEADSAAPDATTAGPDDSGPADPGVASETVAFGDAVAPGTNGSTAGTTAEPAGDPTVEPATDPIADPAAGSAA